MNKRKIEPEISLPPNKYIKPKSSPIKEKTESNKVNQFENPEGNFGQTIEESLNYCFSNMLNLDKINQQSSAKQEKKYESNRAKRQK